MHMPYCELCMSHVEWCVQRTVGADGTNFLSHSVREMMMMMVQPSGKNFQV